MPQNVLGNRNRRLVANVLKNFDNFVAQITFTCSKLIIETLKKV